MSKRFAIIGFGAITEEMVRCLEEGNQLANLAGVLVRPQRLAEAQEKSAGRFAVVDNIVALLALEPDVVAECAGHGAMRQYGPAVLAHGTDLLCSSVGVLADRAFAAAIAQAAKAPARLLIPSGAVAGIDGLLAARTAGLRRVTYTSVKPPIAWKGTPAEKLLESSRGERTTFFEGSAREAALQYRRTPTSARPCPWPAWDWTRRSSSWCQTRQQAGRSESSKPRATSAAFDSKYSPTPRLVTRRLRS